MTNEKAIQKAGDNSQQYQANTINIIQGIDEKRAREICSEMQKKAMEVYTAESQKISEKRIRDFADILIPRIEKIEKGFEAFADPEFQLELKKAQITSACTDKKEDYELLTELLTNRINNDQDRKIKASVSKAIEIINQIDDDALSGLTVVSFADHFLPNVCSISDGLNMINKAFGLVINKELPNGDEWCYHLDILDAVRVLSIGRFSPFIEVLFNSLNGFTCVGIEKNSQSYEKALTLLKENNVDSGILVEHELYEGYVRLPVVNKLQLSQLIILNNNPFIVHKITINQISALSKIWELYDTSTSKQQEIKNEFTSRINALDNLKYISEWWSQLPCSFKITPVGDAIAYANFNRINKT